jgi:hypothetical protein
LIIVVLLTSWAQRNIDIEIHYKISSHFPVFLPFAKLVDSLQQMDPAKQAKVMQEFQKQSAQMDMTVSWCFGFKNFTSWREKKKSLFSFQQLLDFNNGIYNFLCRLTWCQMS